MEHREDMSANLHGEPGSGEFCASSDSFPIPVPPMQLGPPRGHGLFWKVFFSSLFMVFIFVAIFQTKVLGAPTFQDMNIPPLSFKNEGKNEEGDDLLMQKYIDYYGFNLDQTSHHFGFFRFSNFKIFSHGFILPESKGTVLMLHGYFDHSGTMAKLVQACIHAGVSVVTLDLPGHGLSSGERGHISDFSLYSGMLEAFVEDYGEFLPQPLHMMGFSTGGGIVYDFIRREERELVDKIVLISPLVRLKKWPLLKFLVPFTDIFFDYLPRVYAESSSDESFMAFLKSDPLELDAVSIGWLDSVFAWNEDIGRQKNGPLVFKDVLVIQGTKDEVVDWKYNLSFLEERIEGIRIEIIGGARHHVANEAMRIRQEAFGKAIHFLLE